MSKENREQAPVEGAVTLEVRDLMVRTSSATRAPDAAQHPREESSP